LVFAALIEASAAGTKDSTGFARLMGYIDRDRKRHSSRGRAPGKM